MKKLFRQLFKGSKSPQQSPKPHQELPAKQPKSKKQFHRLHNDLSEAPSTLAIDAKGGWNIGYQTSQWTNCAASKKIISCTRQTAFV